MVDQKKEDHPIEFPTFLLSLVKFAHKPDGSRYNIEPIHVEVSDKGVCTLIATNAHALAFVELEGNHGPERSFGILNDAAVGAMKHRPKGNAKATAGSLSFESLKGCGRIAFNYEPTEGGFPDWRAAIKEPTGTEKIVALAPEYLKLAAELAIKFSMSAPAIIFDRLHSSDPNHLKLEYPAESLARVEFVLMPMRSIAVDKALGK